MTVSWHDSHRKETEEGAVTAQAEHSWSLLSKNVLKDPYVSLSYVSHLRRASTLDDLLFDER